MKTPAINTKFINTLPVLLSSSVCAWFVWHFAKEQYFAALILGVIAGGLVDLDNGLTGKAKNVMYAVAAFAVSSLSVSLAFNHPVALAVTFTAFAPYPSARWPSPSTPRFRTTRTRRSTKAPC